MTLPSVSISKATFSSSQAPASSVGILAILAASSTGTELQAGAYARSDLAVSAFGYGPLTEYAAYDIAVANQPCVLVKGHATVNGAYSAVTKTMTGTANPVAGTTKPFDRYAVIVTIVAAGAAGTAGVTYTYSLDGGNTTSGVNALGTSLTLTIPNSGVSFTVLTAATFVAGDTWSCFTTAPLMNDTDVINALTSLANGRQPWEGALVDCSASGTTVGLVDTFLSGLEAKGVFKFVLLNTRFKDEPEPTAEDEPTYAAALGAQFASATSIRACVGADGAHVPSQITGYNIKRPTSLLLGARAMSIPIGEDAAYVSRGALSGAQIADNKGNPLDHDEDLYPTLDSQRFTTLRSFAPGGPQGVYITNPNTIQPSGGQFPYLQHIRIMNRACEIAWYVLTTQLSRGVRKNPKPDPVTGAVYIFEPDASAIEALVNDALLQPLKGQISDVRFSLSRTDNMNAVPCIVTGVLALVALAYIKGYSVQATFTKTLTTTV